MLTQFLASSIIRLDYFDKENQMTISYEHALSEYIEYLHVYGVGSKQAERFKHKYWRDMRFRRQAQGIERFFENADGVLRELDDGSAEVSSIRGV